MARSGVSQFEILIYWLIPIKDCILGFCSCRLDYLITVTSGYEGGPVTRLTHSMCVKISYHGIV